MAERRDRHVLVVGVLHLVGDDGIVAELREHGLEVLQE